MTDDELASWKKEYEDLGFSTWITRWTEIESYFCTSKYVADALGISPDDGKAIVDVAYEMNEDELRIEFENKRREVNKLIYEKKGGSPDVEAMWVDKSRLFRVKGKTYLRKIRSVAKDWGHDEKSIGRIIDTRTVAVDLVKRLTNMLP